MDSASPHLAARTRVTSNLRQSRSARKHVKPFRGELSRGPSGGRVPQGTQPIFDCVIAAPDAAADTVGCSRGHTALTALPPIGCLRRLLADLLCTLFPQHPSYTAEPQMHIFLLRFQGVPKELPQQLEAPLREVFSLPVSTAPRALRLPPAAYYQDREQWRAAALLSTVEAAPAQGEPPGAVRLGIAAHDLFATGELRCASPSTCTA